ncbi:unnamed protein product [Cuscuta campestris]|uniref:Homeobox domain-containing protein n=1 Tax=Cuscuta campestris TaxID=132261 RepID=A0A484LBL8_9ASTE|nr:unnamed protein product [Cuscuta campestris]
MQSVFSIKDVIGKKETREISALFGVTVTQVRDFFNTQRARVRKLVGISREKTKKSIASNEPCEEISLRSDASLPVDPAPLDSVVPLNVEGPSCSTEDEVPSGVQESDKDFIENIFILMRNEDTFSGQVKLMDWIMEIQNPSVLLWFLSKGGVMILATWLSQAATEEQTSVLHSILKVLCHLPLHQALPAHMSAILQSVNKLRFYRISDISNRARFLLFRWSKKLASQSSKKPIGLKSVAEAQDEILLKRSIGEVMAEVDGFEESLAQFETSENLRKLGSTQPLKLLTSVDESNRRTGISASPAQSQERRKVQLVEQPGQRMAGRKPQATKTSSATQGRPLSADDIQKAKLRAQLLQSKYGKGKTSFDHSLHPKPDGPNKYASPLDGSFHSTIRTHDLPNINDGKSNVSDGKPTTDEEKPAIDVKKTIDRHTNTDGLDSNRSKQQEARVNEKRDDAEEPLWKKCKRIQIPWYTPPEMAIPERWKLCAGENSQEVENQKNRIHREKETIYRTLREIPLNPKEPWDQEMDYDDTLTPQIPTEQLPDGNSAEDMARDDDVSNVRSHNVNNTADNMAEPDLELLAVLLKNPELVFALTSGQAGNLSSEETVKLLDMIKANGLMSMSGPTVLDQSRAECKVEVCLPSPTPSSNPGTSGVKVDDYDQNPFSRRGGGAATAAAMAYASQHEAAAATAAALLLQPTGGTSSLLHLHHQPPPHHNNNGGIFLSPPLLPPQETPSHHQFHAPPPPQSGWQGGAVQAPPPHTNSNNYYYNNATGAASHRRRNDQHAGRPGNLEPPFSSPDNNSPGITNSNNQYYYYNHSPPPETMTSSSSAYHHDPNWSVNKRWSDHRRR